MFSVAFAITPSSLELLARFTLTFSNEHSKLKKCLVYMFQHNLMAEVYGDFTRLHGLNFGPKHCELCALGNHVPPTEFASNADLCWESRAGFPAMKFNLIHQMFPVNVKYKK